MMFLLYLPLQICFLLIYFSLAVRFQIIDKPNQRSSHSSPTIRGGGIIFPIALLPVFFVSGFTYSSFITGLLLISFISFYDDLRPLPNMVRLLAQFISVSLLLSQTGFMNEHWWLIIVSFVVIIGSINAYNFMDGINGLTGAYSFIMVGSLYFINTRVVEFIPDQWLIVCGTSILAFNLFNFRAKAKCFAGDVGSISIAFILIFFTLLLIRETGNIKYVGLFLLYGLDSITTIIFRLFRSENIFDAHRSHFYQYLVHARSWSHLAVSSLYAFLQLSVNVIIISVSFNLVSFAVFLLFSGLIVLTLRLRIEGRKHLLGLGA